LTVPKFWIVEPFTPLTSWTLAGLGKVFAKDATRKEIALIVEPLSSIALAGMPLIETDNWIWGEQVMEAMVFGISRVGIVAG
jgi:hypothetical protein